MTDKECSKNSILSRSSFCLHGEGYKCFCCEIPKDPPEKAQELWIEELKTIFNRKEGDVFGDLKAFISQQIRLAERRGEERGYRKLHKS